MLENIIKQLKLVYDGDPWYGQSLKKGIASVNSAHINKSLDNGMHTIAELTVHLIGWREFAGGRLSGETEYLPEQEQTFDWKSYSIDQKNDWDILKNRLDDSQQNLLELLGQYDDSLLSQYVSGKSYTYNYLLNGIIQHDIYHLGQIIYIGKLFDRKNKKLHETGYLKYSYLIFPYEILAQNK